MQPSLHFQYTYFSLQAAINLPHKPIKTSANYEATLSRRSLPRTAVAACACTMRALSNPT